ncbi:MAG: MBL fold metallo-hydrolase, partial [Chloroflexia bacterium]|nr:MBL fold metallo-hydrolase [Chloroflexia bacterium]
MLDLTFLGTGTSNGVPVIGCECAVCHSPDPRDRRTRSSVVIRDHERVYLIDTATELRAQALAAGLNRVDAVLMTHAHADHTGGFDDLRRFNELMGRHLPVYANPITAAMLRERYAYAFVDQYPFYGGKPDLLLHDVDAPFTPFDREIVPLPVFHGRLPILGYRIGPIAYITDAKTIPASTLGLLDGLEILVLNGLRDHPHPTHLSIAEAVAIIRQVQPRRAYLTHLSHELSHAAASGLIPAGIE